MLTGFLLINKPAGRTSFSCVSFVKRVVGKGIRVGHAGTLDRFATGLLIIGIGRSATKHLGLLLNLSKTYIGTGKLGDQTDTLDPYGQVIKTSTALINQTTLEQALASFGTGYLQVPPVYSALKFAGQRLSDLHRSSQDLTDLRAQAHNLDVHQIARDKSRFINLYDLELQEFNNDLFKLRAHVSSGTYIRVLINDIAIRSGSCATTIALCRTKIGPFDLAQALDLEDLDLAKINQNMISVSDLQLNIQNN